MKKTFVAITLPMTLLISFKLKILLNFRILLKKNKNNSFKMIEITLIYKNLHY